MKTIPGSITLATKLDKALAVLPNPSQVLKSKAATIALFNKVAKHPDIFPQIGSYKAALCSLQPVIDASNKASTNCLQIFSNNSRFANSSGQQLQHATMALQSWK